ncbi:hypothetical protein ACIBTZ_33665 [Micromonospora sp. NPDC049460]|uniref:hypothetical protein n=1 Tax=unclassified Micromonospora TaxID=2617518 RepID=UPI003723A3AB
MSEDPIARPPMRAGPPPRHHMALMIWLAVFPTLTVLQLLLGDLLRDTPTVLRTLVLATLAVPIVIYGLLPPLQRLRMYVIGRRA